MKSILLMCLLSVPCFAQEMPPEDVARVVAMEAARETAIEKTGLVDAVVYMIGYTEAETIPLVLIVERYTRYQSSLSDEARALVQAWVEIDAIPTRLSSEADGDRSLADQYLNVARSKWYLWTIVDPDERQENIQLYNEAVAVINAATSKYNLISQKMDTIKAHNMAKWRALLDLQARILEWLRRNNLPGLPLVVPVEPIDP